jgi:SSS family solute:Na+ symporter
VFPVIAAVGIAATVYACLGGMRAVIWTDVLQAVMLFGGVALIVGYVAAYDGSGVGTWWNKIAASGESPQEVKWATWDITERTTILWAICGSFAWQCCTHCSDQVALQRYFTTDSAAAARNSFLVNIISASAIGLLLGFAGLALGYFYLEYPKELGEGGLTAKSGADDLMPFFYANQLPAGFAGLILVSFLCDAMQTLVSGVNSISAIITKDVTDHRGPSARLNELWLARAVTVFVGVASTGLALAAGKFALNAGHTIFDMLPRMFLMFLGPMGAMFMVGMFFRRATPRVILATVLITQAFSFLWSWWAEIPALAGQMGLTSLAEYWPSILGYDGEVLRKPSVMLAVGAPGLFGIVLGGLLSLLFGNSNHLGTAYTWRAVLSRPSENA